MHTEQEAADSEIEINEVNDSQVEALPSEFNSVVIPPANNDEEN
jgi:hypothetical protein